MKSKSYIFLFLLIFMIVFSLSAVSADDLQTTYSGEVSGDVDVVTESPWDTSGELNYDIPNEAKDIKEANVYVNVYSGSAENTYGAIANVSLETINGESHIASEELWIEDGSADGTVYRVNDHTDKCYSDYQMRYNITNSLKGLNGTSIAIKVDTFKMENKSFDGRIKLISLVLAYDDGDDDMIFYWVDSTQRWTKNTVTTTFETANVKGIADAELTNVALSSSNGNFTLNGEALGNPDKYSSGSYYQYSYWDVSDVIDEGSNTEISSEALGSSLKNVLTVLKLESEIIAYVSFNTEYTSVPTCYAGTNNTLTINVNANKAGKYTVKLGADGIVVNSTEVELDGENVTTLQLTDPNIRPVDETTVKGANNTKVVYEVGVFFDDLFVGYDKKTVPVLFNGNLDYRMEYNESGFLTFVDVITGDIVIDVQDAGYLGSSAMNRTDVWTVNMPENSTIHFAFIFVPYNWFNSNNYNETDEMFDVTFNGETVEAYDFWRDQSNLGSYGGYGYGVLIYEVSALLNTSGDNTFVLNKNYPTPAVYPGVLAYGYDIPGGNFKDIAYFDGADLLSNANNDAGRIVKTVTSFISDDEAYVNATLYVLAAGAQAGEGNIIFNDVEFVDVWNGTSSTTSLFVADVTRGVVVDDLNNISFVSTGSTILALPQFIVCDSGFHFHIESVETEYTSVPCVYAGTNNTFTVTVNSSIEGEFNVELWIEDQPVDGFDVKLTKGINKIVLTDPNIYPIDETTVNGGDNVVFNYMVYLKYSDWVTFKEISVPLLYNGYLGYDMEYDIKGFESWITDVFTGDIVVDIQDASTYMGASVMNRTDVWTVNVPEGSELTIAYLIVPYNWYNAKTYDETEFMFNVTFNGVYEPAMGFYRDQGNLGKYGKYGYGVLFYDVVDKVNVSGVNTVVINKKDPTPAVYPSVLVYMYDTPGGTMKEVRYMIGADLLANDYNKAGRTVESNTNIIMGGDEFINATLYVLAGGAQAGEGNIIVNGKEFVDVWDGTSSTTGLFTADISDILNKTNDISFVATGSTILALPHFIVADTGFVMDINSVETEYTKVPCIYAGTNNTFAVNITNSMEGEFIFSLIDITGQNLVDKVTVNLTSGTNVVYLTDPTIRPINETTVNGANNTVIEYLVDVEYDGYFLHEKLFLPVLYNGYLGYDKEYDVKGFESWLTDVFTGDIVVDIQDASTYMGASVMNRTEVWTVNVPEGSELDNVYLIVPYNWYNANTYDETEFMFNVTVNGIHEHAMALYRDQGNLGNYGKYGYGILFYDVTDEINVSGVNTVVINKKDPTPAVYPSVLVYMYDTPGGTMKEVNYMIGADLLANDYNKAGRTVESNTNITMGGDKFINATLYVLAGGAQAGEGNIIVNGKEFVDVWDGTSSTTGLFTADISDILNKTNDISFVATGSTILALPHFIVADTGMIMDINSVETEYTKVPCIYAGTNNTFAVNITNSMDGEFTFLILDITGHHIVDEVTVNLTSGTNVVYLTDPTIRPINETTVNGANNTINEYLVNVYYKDYADHKKISLPVLYNGYLGYDKEYDVKGFESWITGVFTGDIVIDVKDAGTYMSSGVMNRTDVWTVNVPEGSELNTAFLFVPYNWYNAKTYNETEFMFNVTVNGVHELAMGFYRDQANLGTSGKYGYGLLFYEIADELNVSGVNTVVINKKDPTPAVYPSVLVYMYDTPGGTMKEVNYMMGADLLANDYNKAGRTVESNTIINMDEDSYVNATLYVLAGGAQAGEGNIIINDKVFENVWDGTSSTTGLFTADIIDILNKTNAVSFVATGSTILALPHFIVADTGLVMDIDSIETEYTSVPCIYAGTNNTFTVTITNNVDGEFTFYLMDVNNKSMVDKQIVNLTRGTNVVYLTDPTIRPINETTVNGANNTKIRYIVSVGYEEYYDHEDLILPVLFNGNLGYDMEYNDSGFDQFSWVVDGDVVVDVKDASSYLGSDAMNRTDVWTVNITEDGAYLSDACLMIPYNWFNSNKYNETLGMFNVTFNGKSIVPAIGYRDQSNLGKYGGYGYGVLIYRVKDLLDVNGDNTLVLNKNYPTPAVYPSVLVYLYNVPGGTFKEVQMLLGADLLANTANVAGRPVKSDITVDMVQDLYVNATLYVLAGSAQAGEGNIIVNGKEFVDVWDGTSSTTGLFTANITDILNKTNDISFVSTGNTILALPQIIVADTGMSFNVDSIATEYKNTCFAGTNNTLTVTVSSSIDGEFTLYLYADDVLVSSVDVNLTKGTHTIKITDPTIRPVDETTVNGANNTEVTYLAKLVHDSYFYDNYAVVPVLYNGYLGKDLEYNATYIEDVSIFTVSGGIFGDYNSSSYMSASQTNRVDVWNIENNGNMSIVKAFVYLAYNWDKSGVNGPVFNTTFNGVSISPKAHYRDQSNLGTSGVYGYGLFVYDVTDLIQFGNNTFVLDKENGLTAVYPTSFMGLFNLTVSDHIGTIYLFDGVDLLYNNYNAAGRPVETTSQIDVDLKGAQEVFYNAFAAGAQKGEGNIIFNGKQAIDVWNGTSQSIEMVSDNVYDIVESSNTVQFVSTGGTILALNQFLMVSKDKARSSIANISVDGNGKVSAVLIDNEGNAIANGIVRYGIDGIKNTTVTDENGVFSISAGSNANVEILYIGNETFAPAFISITLNDIAPAREATVIKAEDYYTDAIDYYAGERGGYFKVQLFDAQGNPLANKTVKIGFNGVVYTKETNATGWAQLQINLAGAGTYTFAIAFLGDNEYNGTFVVQKIVVNKKKTSISASAKTYKASAKTKSYTVTLKTDKGSSIDGKTYLKSGKKITLKINGKTYTAKTNSKGQATFKLSITKKGKFVTAISFGGDKTYAASSKSVKITIK